jgi:hypothetical protein
MKLSQEFGSGGAIMALPFVLLVGDLFHPLDYLSIQGQRCASSPSSARRRASASLPAETKRRRRAGSPLRRFPSWQSLSRAGLYWNASCSKEIGSAIFWPKETLDLILAQYKKDHLAPHRNGQRRFARLKNARACWKQMCPSVDGGSCE